MRANKHARKKMADDRGEVGIGTMIVFIAAVIVAAVAAAVLINTAGNLERKASETGKETTEEVSANIFIRDIIGFSNSTGDGMDRVAWYIALAPGSEPIDLNLTVIQWNDGTTLADIPASSLACDDANFDELADGFCVRHVFDTGDNNRYVVSPGDRVRVEVQLGPGEHVEMRKTIRVLFLPEVGSPVEATFSTPSTFGNQNQVSLK